MTEKNWLAEQVLGPGAVRGVGKLVFWNTSGEHETEGRLTAVVGSMVGDILDPKIGNHEMWECEIFIYPIRKYRDSSLTDNSKKSRWGGYRADQILASNFGDPAAWNHGKAYWHRLEPA